MYSLPFDYKKAVQAINFFACKNGGSIDKLRMLKLVYFADRYHLRKYGRLITNDQYWAMKFGPVASSVKEMAELDSLCGTERHYAGHYLAKGDDQEGEPGYLVKSLDSVDSSVFSESDLEALKYVWDRFGNSLRSLVNITHKYPEWKRHESQLEAGLSRVPMDIFDFFDDPEEGNDPCWPLNEEDRQIHRDALAEQNRIEALWR